MTPRRVRITDAVLAEKLADTHRDALCLIRQGAIWINDERIEAVDALVPGNARVELRRSFKDQLDTTEFRSPGEMSIVS